MTPLEAVGLTKRYDAFAALDDVSFSLRPGCVTGLLGPNGSGKTTTMRIALGLERPSAGSVRVLGRPVGDLDHPVQRVGALLDAGWVHPNRSARDHLRWIAAASSIAPARVAPALEEVGLGAVADTRVGTFSLGMRQRLGLATAILGDPELLVLDEPLNGLDPDGARWLRGLLLERARAGCAVLVATHLLDELEATAERLLVMAEGRLRFDGTVAELCDDGGPDVVELECADPVAAAELLNDELGAARARAVDDARGVTVVRVTDRDVVSVGSSCERAGISVRRIERRSTSLGEVYSALTGEGRTAGLAA